MLDETLEQTDDESVNYIPAIASVISIIAIPFIYTKIVRRRRARETKTTITPMTLEELVVALKETPTMYFCNN